jgi:hypothetical protein
MRTFLLLILFLGIVLIIVNEKIYEVPPRVEYRYLPRDLDTYLRETTHAHAQLQDMYAHENPWNTKQYY